jgi:hypothetical protein
MVIIRCREFKKMRAVIKKKSDQIVKIRSVLHFFSIPLAHLKATKTRDFLSGVLSFYFSGYFNIPFAKK